MRPCSCVCMHLKRSVMRSTRCDVPPAQVREAVSQTGLPAHAFHVHPHPISASDEIGADSHTVVLHVFAWVDTAYHEAAEKNSGAREARWC